MLQLIARKQEVEKNRIDALAAARQVPDQDSGSKFITTDNKYVGKELKIRDAQDPEGRVALSSASYDEKIAQYKMHEESMIDLSSYILDAG